MNKKNIFVILDCNLNTVLISFMLEVMGLSHERKVMAEISIVPVGSGNASISVYIASCLNVLKKKPDLK